MRCGPIKVKGKTSVSFRISPPSFSLSPVLVQTLLMKSGQVPDFLHFGASVCKLKRKIDVAGLHNTWRFSK